MGKKLERRLAEFFGFQKNSEYVKDYLCEANIRSGVYMSAVVIALEIWMVLRYIFKYMLPEGRDMVDFWLYTRNFWALLLTAILMFTYGVNVLRSRKINRRNAGIVIIIFSVLCLMFGMWVSFNDFKDGKQILCFVTMVMFVGGLLIWKPYLTVLLLTAAFGFFFEMLSSYSGVEIRSGDKVNYITLYISVTMVCCSIYYQRKKEAVEAEELEKAAVQDDLTKVHNMRHFIRQAMSFLQNPQTKLSDKIFLYLNIENFKIYNDQRGFIEGNEFLKAKGEMLLEEFPDALIARQSDDHFVLLTNASGFYQKLERVNTRIRQFEREIYLPLKVGGYRPLDRKEDIRRCVDRARYACSLLKNKSDALYQEYDQSTHTYFKKRTFVINHLESAIENHFIKVYYQPVVWSEDGSLCGCEALARWIDPVQGFFSPGDFIPILEECRLIHKLDTCIYEIVCRDIRRTLDKGLTAVPISLNFSRLDFELMDAVEVLDGMMKKYNVPKNLVHVEITESALTDNMLALEDAMKRFRNKGYAIWMDDFGSGYSSLNTLKDYQFDVLKIDMQFLEHFDSNPKSKDILASIVELADKLGMKTLTEGVETEEQAKYLRDIGCGKLQGFLFGKPMEYETLEQCILEGTYKIKEGV